METSSAHLGRSKPPSGQTTSSADEAEAYIRQLIFDGKLRPGSRVPQREIATALGCSRVPVREALIALARGGWVRGVVNQGAYVASLTADAVEDHFELLSFALGLAARRAIEKGPPWLPKRLDELVLAMRDTADAEIFRAAAFAFHNAIVEAADSQRISSTLGAEASIMSGNLFEEVPDAVPMQRRSAEAIRRAIARKDADAAAREYQWLCRGYAGMAVELLAARGLLEL